MDLSSFLANLRTQRGLSRAEVIRRVGMSSVTQTAMARLEAGEWSPDGEQIRRIIAAMDPSDEESRTAWRLWGEQTGIPLDYVAAVTTSAEGEAA